MKDVKEISRVFNLMDYTVLGPIIACVIVILICLVATCFWVRHRQHSQGTEGNIVVGLALIR